MKTVRYFFVLAIFFVAASHLAVAQQSNRQLRQLKGGVNAAEIVTLDSSVSVANALDIINVLAKQFAGKVIVDPIKMKTPIGVLIVNQQWRDAMESLLSHNGLWYNETDDYIQIITAAEAQRNGQALNVPGGNIPKDTIPTLADRDVKISAVFFDANLNKLQDYGISWNFFRPKQSTQPQVGGKLSSNISSTDQSDTIVNNAVASLSTPPSFSFANIDGLIKFFGTNGLGEVITSPDVTVRNGREGKIQIGTDIFITTRDFAGNTINQQVSTGTIIDVTPKIYMQNDTEMIALSISVQQSSVNPDKSINKTQVSTSAIMYDGEETTIGGLVSTVDETTREGIPFLKDLPPWFLGLRYLFGSESIVKTKQELIVLLRVELLPQLRARYSERNSQENILEKKKREYQNNKDY
ncbi:MAG TPA: type II and III secretion system protein [Bacteroidota bacterium]|nr:type II and III secretion system protein [Bacteroidota bacterium]